MTTSIAAPSRCAATTSAAPPSRAGRSSAPASAPGLALYGARAMPAERLFEAAAAEAAAAPDAPVLVSVFLPGGVDLLDTLVPLHDYGRYADLHPKLKVAGPSARRGRLRRAPRAHAGDRRRRQGPLRARQDRLPAWNRLREPGPVALPLAPLLGDRIDHRRLRAGLARALARPGGRPRQPAAGDLDGLGPLPGDALGARARGGRLLAERRRLLDPRRVGRAVRGGDGRLRPARSQARRVECAQRVAHRGPAREAGRRPARAVPRARRSRPAGVHHPLPGGERLRRAPALSGGDDPAAARHPRGRRRDARRLRHARQPGGARPAARSR